jgi:FkbM family methyltransferase
MSMLTHFIYNSERNFIFAYVPKVACTNWKCILRYLDGHENYLDTKIAHDREKSGLLYLSDMPNRDELLSDPSIRKFTFVRDPYTRILSAYANKIEPITQKSYSFENDAYFTRIWHRIEQFRIDRFPDKARIDFECFLAWLEMSGDPLTKDEHWVPQEEILGFEENKYDFIGRFENIERDAKALLHLMGCDIPFPSREAVGFPGTNAATRSAKYYSDEAISAVQRIFKRDFQYLGYNMRSNLKSGANMTSLDNGSVAPTKASFLSRLKEAGISIETVVDVGVQSGTPELLEAFPIAKHLLFEPSGIHTASIQKLFGESDFELFEVACSDTDGECFLVQRSIDGSGRITHSRIDLKPATVGVDSVVACRRIKQSRLDSLNLSLEGNVLVKIDVDGAELKVLAGGENLLKRTSVVIVEAPMASLVERANYLCARGFRLFEIVDLCYYYGFMSQVDLVFIRENLIASNPALQPWKHKVFDWKQWVPFGR